MATNTDLKEQLAKQYQAAQDSVESIRSLWNDRELLALTKLANGDRGKRKSRISLGDLSTIVLERTGRTVAQLPSGKIRPVSDADETNIKIIELCLSRYVLPNANDQFPMPIKLFLIDYLSDLYGGLDVLSYWRVDDEYVGPDCQILNPRNVFWQAGKQNKNQSEYVFVSTYVSAKWLEDKKKLDNWNSQAINKVLKQIKEQGSAKPASRDDANRQTANAQSKNVTASWGDTAEIELVTKYERGKEGRWITFLPDFDSEVVRNIGNKNPFGKLPVIHKESQLPSIDTIVGQGAFERGETLQKTLDSITNLTHDGLKYSVYPIHKYNGTQVQRSTLKWQAGAFWNMTNLDAVQVHNVGSQALNTFLPIQQFLTAKMLNQNGTTSTQISETDQVSGFGKTPEALKSQQQREATMDRVSRDRLESFYGELMEDWVNMLCNKQEAPIEFYVYDEEIEQVRGTDFLVKVNKGVQYAHGEEEKPEEERKVIFGSAKITVPKGKLKGRYKYYVDSSSSMMEDQRAEHDSLTEIMTLAMKASPEQINAWLAPEGKSFSLGNAFKRWVITGGTKDWDSIITDTPQQPMQPQVPPEMMAQLMQQQAMQQQPPMPPQMPPQMPQQMPPEVPQQDQGFSNYQPDPFTEQIVNQIQQGGF